MITTFVCKNGRVEQAGENEPLQALLEQQDAVVWVDLNDPKEDDWQQMERTFAFHPLALEDARKQNQRAKAEVYDTYLFLTMRSWSGDNQGTDDLVQATQEIDVFLGANYLVTIHDGTCDVVAQTQARWRQNPRRVLPGPATLLYELMDALVDDFFPAMDALDELIDDLENQIYATQIEFDMAPALRLKKRLLLLRQTVSPMRDVLNELLRVDPPLVAQELRPYFQDVYDHTLRLIEQVDLHRDILAGALDAIMAQANTRLNQVMKTLTGVSTVLMSASLIAGIYGMNFEYMPELKTRYGYFGALGAMITVAVSLAIYFRRIKWF